MSEPDPPIPSSRVGQGFDAGAYLDAAAGLVGLEIAPEDRAAVVENLRAIAAVAATLMDEPLPDDLEGGPVFLA